jgi:NAD(P)-dependent dehydrogenase (short-subunit alcohol dehydrogenase family)
MTESGDLSGKVAIVTGAGGGMGLAIARRLASGGARVIANDISLDSAEKTVDDLAKAGHEAVAVAGDVSAIGDVRRMVENTLERFGTIHVLVNNAGVLRPTRVIDIEEDEWDLIIRVNLKGTYLCSRAVLPAMQEQGFGRIVNMSSTAGRSTSTVGGAHYTASKAAVLGFTRHLAREVARDGITVNAVCPGLFDTEMVRATIGQEQMSAYAERFPVNRIGEPREVADVVAFLASDRTSYMTGASLDINGGALMM